jgi:hypothetical protein
MKEQRAKSCSIKALPLFKEERCETIAPFATTMGSADIPGWYIGNNQE